MVGPDYEEDLRLIVNRGASKHLTGHLGNVSLGKLCF